MDIQLVEMYSCMEIHKQDQVID